MYTVKSASKIDSFQDHCVYKQNWLLSKPSETYMVENSIKMTPFKTIWRRKITLKVRLGFISGPSMRNKEDTGQRTQGQLHLSSSFAL